MPSLLRVGPSIAGSRGAGRSTGPARGAVRLVVDATRDRRRQAELLPVGGVLWVYQRSYAPLVALRDGQPVATPAAGVAGEKPMRAGTRLPAPEATLTAVDLPGWYARPLGDRWHDYASPAWRPIRLATRGLWLFLGALIAGGVLRAAGRGLLAVPRLLVAPLRFLVLFVLHPELTPGTTHGSAAWAGWWTCLGLRLRRGRAQFALGRTWVGPLPVTIGVPEVEKAALGFLEERWRVSITPGAARIGPARAFMASYS